MVKTKRCTKCGEEKTLDKFTKDKGRKNGFYPSCKSCNRERNNKRARKCYYKHQPEYKEKSRLYQNLHKEKRYEYTCKWRLNNPKKLKIHLEKYRKKHWNELLPRKKQWKRKARIALFDSYVKDQLCKRTNLQTIDIPIELVTTKREHIKLHRFLKGIENENNEGAKRRVG